MASARTSGSCRIERAVRIIEHLLGLEVDEPALTDRNGASAANGADVVYPAPAGSHADNAPSA